MEEGGVCMLKRKWLIAMCVVLAGNLAAFCPMHSVAGKSAEFVKAEQVSEEIPKQLRMAPSGIAKDGKGKMYLADRSYHVVRKRTKDGKYSILAGREGESGYKDGKAENALFSSPWDIVRYKKGYVISDTENHVIRFYRGGKVTTFAGASKSGYKNATGKKARFNRPTGLATGEKGELYIADTGNNVIRVMDQKGKVTVYAGGKKGCADGTLKTARFEEPTGLHYYKGALYVADSGNHRIVRIKGNKVVTVAGSAKGIEGDADGSAKKARFSNPQDIILYKNDLYISDTGNGSVKKLSQGKVTTLVQAFSMQDKQAPAEPVGLTIQGNHLYIGDIFIEKLIKIKI